ITGKNTSHINGYLGVLGDANLFLINPNGIIFGKGTSLDLNGSFTVTTADSIIFPGYEFNALNPKKVPLIKVDIPIGLNFSKSTGNIVVKGNGYSLYQPKGSAKDPPIGIAPLPKGLIVDLGENLSLIASNIKFDGGIINTTNSNIYLGAVTQGKVGINGSLFGLIPDFSRVNTFGNITFINHSLILVLLDL
ncbi:MAG: filamentous hemagglutinin N-terminal domain-containing protein, partial [Thermosynechococcaceae cyanobacterium]